MSRSLLLQQCPTYLAHLISVVLQMWVRWSNRCCMDTTATSQNSSCPAYHVWCTKHEEHSWRNKNELISDFFLWNSTHRRTNVGWPARNYISSVYTWDIVCGANLERWMIGTDEERESGKSVKEIRQGNDDNDIYIYIYIYISKVGDLSRG